MEHGIHSLILSAWPRHRGVALGSRGNEGDVENDRRRGRMEENGLEFVLDLVVRFPLREEFADNLEHLDPVPLRLLPMGEAGALGPNDSNGESG
ncbi:Protein FAR-RED ELONGATED HYPOCOTYL 3 [Hordeum vulgare]|nr:Protein FAR-RED ELONGATED HYPOCOTYL 3 [Hordeum vulgare]